MRTRSTLTAMTTAIAVALAVLVAGTFVDSAIAGESHTATQTDIDRALNSTPTPTQQQRDQVLSFLARPEVRGVAADHGIDPATLENTVAGMSSDELSPITAQIAQYDGSLAGGDRIVLTSSAVIIILLIIILIIVA